MFTGIVQATAGIAAIHDRAGLRTFTLDFPEGFCQDLAIGASVATDGVCLTVTEILSPTQANFDVMLQSLNITTLGSYAQGDRVTADEVRARLRRARRRGLLTDAEPGRPGGCLTDRARMELQRVGLGE